MTRHAGTALGATIGATVAAYAIGYAAIRWYGR
jgi:hypothetical protein